MSQFNKYYNEIRRISARIHHRDLMDALIQSTIEIDEGISFEEQLGSPQSFVTEYFTILENNPLNEASGPESIMLANLTKSAYANLSMIVMMVFQSLININGFLESNNQLELIAYIPLSILGYLVVLKLLKGKFDNYLGIKRDIPEFLISLVSGFVILILFLLSFNISFQLVELLFFALIMSVIYGMSYAMLSIIDRKLMLKPNVVVTKKPWYNISREVSGKISLLILFMTVLSIISITLTKIILPISIFIYLLSVSKERTFLIPR